jgi:hypothetical protein
MTGSWTRLLELFGENFVSFLLLNCSIFVKNSHSDNLLQISGPPISELSLNSVPAFSDTSQKRVLNRLSMLYGKAILPYHPQVCGLSNSRKILSCYR